MSKKAKDFLIGVSIGAVGGTILFWATPARHTGAMLIALGVALAFLIGFKLGVAGERAFGRQAALSELVRIGQESGDYQ